MNLFRFLISFEFFKTFVTLFLALCTRLAEIVFIFVYNTAARDLDAYRRLLYVFFLPPPEHAVFKAILGALYEVFLRPSHVWKERQAIRLFIVNLHAPARFRNDQVRHDFTKQ